MPPSLPPHAASNELAREAGTSAHSQQYDIHEAKGGGADGTRVRAVAAESFSPPGEVNDGELAIEPYPQY